ncbi:MAG TPA: hypothetical protein VF011_03870 [Terriglobales bacterium]
MRWHIPGFSRWLCLGSGRALLGVIVVPLLAGIGVVSALANAVPAAIVLFDDSHGAAYVQLTGMTLNGKTEVRACEHVSTFDKSAYNSFPRLPLAGATSLQRGDDGTLSLTLNGKTECVVPSNLKFDRQPVLTPAQAADQAVLQGAVVSSSAPGDGIPAINRKVQVLFIAAPDAELAEFLRAQRANTIKDWQDFVTRYASSGHVTEARSSIAALHEHSAEAAFAQYQQSTASDPHFPALGQALREAQAAIQASAGYAPALKLIDGIRHELEHQLDTDRSRLQNFQKALQEHKPGYLQLAAAREHLEQLFRVWPDYAPLLDFSREIRSEEHKVNEVLTNAESLMLAGRYDDAVSALGAYTCFASEMPRVQAILNASYKFHFNRGQQLADQQDWQRAAAEFRQALAIRPESKQATNSLDNAEIQLSVQRDQQQARFAVQKSNEYAAKTQFVEAYELLANLPDSQRALVTTQLSALTKRYVVAATQRAQRLQETHFPIKSRGDEDAICEAYVLLDRVSSLTSDPAVTLKRDFLSSKISAYYVEQASRYLHKSSGSGAAVGWLYLQQAQHYGVTNLDSIKELMARYASVYQRRARLSVGIMLRDQTSRNDNPGFADQVVDAIADGLESSGSGIEVVRKPSQVSDDLQPNFMLVGEILEHRVIETASVDALQSKYRVGTHETKNPVWLQVNDAYDAAQKQLESAQAALADAQSQHRKKEVIAAAKEVVQNAQNHADELRHKLETTDETRVEAVIEPYHYTKKTFDLNASIELAFRLYDRSGNVIGQSGDIRKRNHKSVVVLEDVKPEDTEGITNQCVEPDENRFLTDLEIEARNDLVSAVRARTTELPAKFLQDARRHAEQGDLDAAAEQYVMYLNSTPDNGPPEREEAAKFLHDRFNLQIPLSAKL